MIALSTDQVFTIYCWILIVNTCVIVFCLSLGFIMWSDASHKDFIAAVGFLSAIIIGAMMRRISRMIAVDEMKKYVRW